MARVFITGSADGIGRMAAQRMVAAGHRVVLHARNAQRAEQAKSLVSGAEDVVVGDLSTLAAMRDVVAQVNRLGAFDSVIHNAAVGYQEPHSETVDGFTHVFAINSLAPYVLTCLIERPKRLIYTSSAIHRSAEGGLHDLLWRERPWNAVAAYSETKFHNALLAFAIARRWPHVYTNAVEPGWVPTKMGGPRAPDDLNAAPSTQVWLATSDDLGAKVSGQYFFHQKQHAFHPAVNDQTKQEAFLAECARLSGVSLPA